jgi:hypothetical protein
LVSAVLFAAVCVLWVRSYWWTDLIGYSRPDPIQQRSNSRPAPGYVRYECGYSVMSRRGHIVAISLADYFATTRSEPWHRSAARNSADQGVRVGDGPGPSFLGFAFVSDSQPSTVIIVPYWATALAAGLLPAAWALRKSRQEKCVGLCSRCGYDLRATPDRCPECGAVPTRKGVMT